MTPILTALAITIAISSGIHAPTFAALIESESQWNPRAVSSRGCCGLGQLNPYFHEIKNCFEPVENLTVAAQYLAWLLDHYDGDYEKALVAYMWGPGNLDKAINLRKRAWWPLVPRMVRVKVIEVLKGGGLWAQRKS